MPFMEKSFMTLNGGQMRLFFETLILIFWIHRKRIFVWSWLVSSDDKHIIPSFIYVVQTRNPSREGQVKLK